MQIADTKPLLVPDTSVMLKWCVKEKEDRRQVKKMQGDFLERNINIIVPALLGWELNNYLGRSYPAELALAKYSYFKTFRLTESLLLNLEVSGLAFRIMKKAGVTFYDASYHALALLLKGTFLTADKKYYEKAKGFGNIKLLRDY